MIVIIPTFYESDDLSNWSGTPYYLKRSLESVGIEVVAIKLPEIGPFYHIFFGLFRYLVKISMHKRFLYHLEPMIIKSLVQKLQNKILCRYNYDILMTYNFQIAAFLKISKPIILWNDIPFIGALNFIPSGKNLLRCQSRKAVLMEKLAMNNCSNIIYVSEWAIELVKSQYKLESNKTAIIPHGANIEIFCDRNQEEVKELILSRPQFRCNLLFLAGEWKNKRGNLVIQIAEYLVQHGLPTQLIIAGAPPEYVGSLPKFVEYVGFLNKSKAADFLTLKTILSTSHFLVLPSWAESQGIQYCEANAFGVPGIGTNVGGVSTTIINNVNGKLFEQLDTHVKYANYILEIFENYESYIKLAFSSFNEYQTRLNWSVAARKAREIFEKANGQQGVAHVL